jgi:molybdate transport system substrate-binding protein
MFKYIFLISIYLTSILSAENVKILSAANLKFFFSDIVKAYNKKYPNDNIDVWFNSSGTITKEIMAGKEYDVFLAANKNYPMKVYNNNKAATIPEIYTTGSLILLIAKHKGLNTKKIHILSDPTINEITIANKKSAPYGMAAIEALKNAGLYNKIEKKLFYSTDASNIIGDVLWYGHAGILPKSAVNFLPRGYNVEGENYIQIDQKLYSPIEQYFVYSEVGIKNKAAKRFMKFLLTDGQKIFKDNGYK